MYQPLVDSASATFLRHWCNCCTSRFCVNTAGVASADASWCTYSGYCTFQSHNVVGAMSAVLASKALAVCLSACLCISLLPFRPAMSAKDTMQEIKVTDIEAMKQE